MDNNKEMTLTDTSVEKTEGTVKETKAVEEVKVKTYTDKEVDDIVKGRLDRAFKKNERDKSRLIDSYEKKYGELEATLKAGMEVDDIDTATEKLKEFYEGQGTKIPQKRDKLTEKQSEILGKAEAKEVIDLGIDEMNAEAQRLADIGYDNLSGIEKVVFGELAKKLTYEKKKSELKDKDVDTSILESNDFNEFASQFNDNVSITQIYQMFEKTSKKQESVEAEKNEPKTNPLGSMKSNDNIKELKDFYTPEESRQFSKKDLDNDPNLMKVIMNSMTQWKK